MQRAATLLLLIGACDGLLVSASAVRPSAVRPSLPTSLRARARPIHSTAVSATPRRPSLPVLTRALRSVHTELVRPTLMHGVIAWSVMQRHVSTKAKERKEGWDNREASRITWVGAGVNLGLSIFKLVAGVFGNSAAMLSDAGHSFSDLISDALTLMTLRLAALPPDEDHPYGHGRFESIGSLLIASLLLFAGFSFGCNAYASLRAPSIAPLRSIAVWAASASILSKEILFRATAAIGKRINSPVLLANAWHHRSDALSSVVALMGIGGAMLGMPILDPLAGLVVAAMVSVMGIRIGMEAFMQLVDTLDFEVSQEVMRKAGAVEGVVSVSQVRTRSMGGQTLVDCAIQVEPALSASCAHKLAEEVRWRVLQKVDDVSEVLVHVDTVAHDMTCPLQTNVLHQSRSHVDIEAQVRMTLEQQPGVEHVNSVLVHYPPDGVAVDVHLATSPELSIGELSDVAQRARGELQRQAPDILSVRISADLVEHSDLWPGWTQADMENDARDGSRIFFDPATHLEGIKERADESLSR